MIIYWAWPRSGAGHAMRAAAICRWLGPQVIVVRGINDHTLNRPLEAFEVQHICIPERAEAIEWVRQGKVRTIVVDDRLDGLEDLADFYVWKLGRPRPAPPGIHLLPIEGPGSFFPILGLTDDEILERFEARTELGLSPTTTMTFGIPSTSHPGLVEVHKPDYMLTEWPALRYLRAADRLVGCIGTNLLGEARYLNLRTHWIAAPGEADQAMRLREHNPTATQGMAQAVAQIIEEHHARAQPRV